MILSTLIKKGGIDELATMTAATIATPSGIFTPDVADVAGVTVASLPKLPILGEMPSISVAGVAGVAVAPLPKLFLFEEIKIRSWLTHINESNVENINHVLNKCRGDSNVRRYVLERSKEIPLTKSGDTI